MFPNKIRKVALLRILQYKLGRWFSASQQGDDSFSTPQMVRISGENEKKRQKIETDGKVRGGPALGRSTDD